MNAVTTNALHLEAEGERSLAAPCWAMRRAGVQSGFSGTGLVNARQEATRCADATWLVELVQRMLTLNKQLAKARAAQKKTAIQRQIDALDGQIDRLVYELYDLTDEEIAIVEEATDQTR